MDDNLLQPQPLDTVMAEMKQRTDDAKVDEQETTQVVVTPAWQKVIEQLSAKSSPDAIIKRIKEVVYDGKTSNEQLGELTRVAIMTAEDLITTINQVTETVKAHEK